MIRTIRAVLCVAGTAGLLVLVPIVYRSPEATYGGADPRLLVLEAGAAAALLLVAALGPPRAASILLAIVGGVWLVPEIAGAVGVSLLVRTVADTIAFLIAAILLGALVLRAGPVDARARRALLVSVVGAVVASLARLLLVDPFEDVDCWRTCEHNPLLAGDAGGVGAAVELVALLGLAFGVLWAASLVLRAHPRGPAAPAALAGWLLLGGFVVSLFVRPREVSVATEDVIAVTLFVVVQLAAMAWLAAAVWEIWLRWRLESRLAHLVDLLGSTADPEVLARSLRSAVRDPGLRLAYWAASRECYVDAAGHPTTLVEPGPGERLTTVVRRGQIIAAVVHSRRVDGARLERALGPAIRLALENTQLRAAALAELNELTTSRTRVVEQGELERRRLERNLHDGAQQRAVSLSLLVRLLVDRSPAIDQNAAQRAEALTRTLIEELRRVARGIYPTVLADAGLTGAIVDLAERSSDFPIVVEDLPQARYPGTVETTAFLVVRAGILDAHVRGATSATVNGTQLDGTLRVGVQDDASPVPELVVTEFDDQVGALGGTLMVSGAPGCRRIEVTLPCGS